MGHPNRGRHEGAVELVPARGPGRDTVLGHFTFTRAARLQGGRVDAAGVLPAPSGALQLSRVPLP